MSAAASSAWDKNPAPPSGERRPSFGGEKPRGDKGWGGAGLIIALVASIGLHGVIVAGTLVVNYLEERSTPPPAPVIELVDASQFPRFVPPPPAAAMSAPAADAPVVEPDVPFTKPKQQVVDLAAPDSPQAAPKDAKYLAEHDHNPAEETASRETAIAPKVLAKEFRGTGESAGEESSTRVGSADLQGEGIGTDAETRRAKAGEPDRQPAERRVEDLLTSDPFGILVKRTPAALADGGRAGTGGDRDVDTTVGGSGTKVAMAGAPNNDYLPNVRPGDKTQLKAKAWFFTSFWTRLQKQVEPFWISNVRRATPGQIQKRDYMTRVNVTLSPDGAVTHVEVMQSCGIPAWDRAVVEAFREASPFLNPPAALVEADGFIHIGDLGFIVVLTGGGMQPAYADPRQGKMFPGIGEGYGPGGR